MITDQFLLSMHQADHPNRHILSQPAPQRNMRKTITSRSNNIQHLVPDDGHISKADYKIRLKTIHSNAVSEYVDEYKSKILGCKPPPPLQIRANPPQKDKINPGPTENRLQPLPQGLQLPYRVRRLGPVPAMRLGTSHHHPPVQLPQQPHHPPSHGPLVGPS